jgi:hypothetical protein
MPGLEVDKVGSIRFPLDAAQARKLIKQCSQAPYGKGTKTLVDTAVRRVWELDPDCFTLLNPKWSGLVSAVASDVQQALGLERKLTAHLYKLLLYGVGVSIVGGKFGQLVSWMLGLPIFHAQETESWIEQHGVRLS